MAEPIRIVGGGDNEGVQATVRKLTSAVPIDVSIVDSSGNQLNPFAVPTTVGNGSKNVTTAGTAVALASSTACKRVYITAKSTNTGKIFIGGSSVSSTSGMFIYASYTFVMDIDNLSDVYIDASISGEGVQYTYVS